MAAKAIGDESPYGMFKQHCSHVVVETLSNPMEWTGQTTEWPSDHNV